MFRIWALYLLALLLAAPAQAAVTISFYSHDFRMFGAGLLPNFPHGFIILSGTPDDGTPAVSGNFGPPPASSSMRCGSRWKAAWTGIRCRPITCGADRHFSFPLTDPQYHAVVAVVETWRSYPQPSHDIDKHNCVTFVKELAIAAGLTVSESQGFIRKPKQFLADMATRNATFLAPYGSVIQVSAPGAGMDALRERTRQLESQVKAVKERN